jgi:TetR/AcrR family transcriptional regulator
MKGKPLDETSALKIKNAAREVFLDRGYDGATMQEIADRAGFNKAQLHYYFRNKDSLFLLIFEEEFQFLLSSHAPLFTESTAPVAQKLAAFIDAEAAFLSRNPRLPLFIISETHRNKSLITELLKKLRIPGTAKKLAEQMNEELKALGCPFSFEEIMLMLRSILVYPILDEATSSLILGLKPDEFKKIRARQGEIAKELLRRLLAQKAN